MRITISRCKIVLTLAAAVLATSAMTSTSFAQDTMMKHGDKMMMKDGMMKKGSMMETKLGLGGYCPVCIIDAKKWEKGKPEIASTFDGVSYQFPNEAIQAKFDANPQRYVPVLNGDCIVCYEKHDKRVGGTVQHAAYHNSRLYLFPDDKTKQAFLAEPVSYRNSDVALDGECIVCLAKGKHMPGNSDHAVIHNGLRYLFPSDNEAGMFRGSPKDFVSKVSNMKAPMTDKAAMGKDTMMKKDVMTEKDAMMKKEVMMKKTSMKDTDSNGVRLVGRSGCAACEFGVNPIGAPGELGLAVVGADGRITVVEGAHKQYPQIYKDRFENKQLAVEGKIVKSQGKIAWIQPTSLKTIN